MENNWYNLSVSEASKKLDTDLEKGLKAEEVEKRQAQYGFNELKEKKKKSLLIKFLEQFKDFMIIILIIAAIVSAIIGVKQGEGFADSIIIMVVVIANAIIGLVQEDKAEKSLEALKKMSSHVAKVYRDGKITIVKSRELVPGDVVELDTGDYVPADLRIINSINLKVQESALTGESVPVDKTTEPIKGEVLLGDRKNLLFSSSMVTYGRGKGIVVSTGMETEVGKIATMIDEVEEKETLLQARLNTLGKTLGILCIIICIVIFAVGLAYGKDPINMFMTAVSLAVAAIPEGLAAISTIVLAIGVQRMVKKNAIVKKLPAVETLGSASVICTDKTGTLTQNKMTVKKIYTNGKLENVEDIENSTLSTEQETLIENCMLCNDTKIGNDNLLTGDPTETALVDMGFKFKYTKDIYKEYPRIAEIPFDSERKLMTTVHKVGDKFVVYTKGGVDELLECCKGYIINGDINYDLDSFKANILKENEAMAENALRVLSMGYKEIDHPLKEEDMKNLEKDLIYIGMVGMIDPPRIEVKDAVSKCKKAGIRTVMITGDHKITAVAIAKELGILNEGDWAITGNELEKMSDEDLEKNVKNISVYARVSPEHKVRIVKAWQANKEVVAMTGDGVNDAPALKMADIGCAMGIVGTDVSKEAADVILTDDNFATIVSAVEEGRRIFDNILKAITFLLSSNIGEIIVLFLAILLTPFLAQKFGITGEFINNIVPLIPVQILWINLVTDSLPALALAVDPPDKNIMSRKPNKNQNGIFTSGMTFRIIYQGVLIGLITLAAFVIGLSTKTDDIEYKIKVGQTMAFAVLAFAELVHVFNIRNNKESIFKSNPFNNSKLLLAISISALLMFAVLLVPALREIFHLILLPVDKLFETIILVLVPIVVVEIMKFLRINSTKDENC
ncbi:MAG: calcium-translocating P-type ATPase, PMCA-type [Clostridia bacterium]|nr:calcium-translocating P-type ATPase, PMCA-type [Clostridia bacterium]